MGLLTSVFPYALLSSRVKCGCGKNERNVWAHYVGHVIYNQFLYLSFMSSLPMGVQLFFVCLSVFLEYVLGRQPVIKRGDSINKNNH